MKTVATKPPKKQTRKEILAVGPPAFAVKETLPELANSRLVQHSVEGLDGMQQFWNCGDWAVRGIISVQDLVAELKKGKPALCVLEDQSIIIQANVRRYARLRVKAEKLGKPPPQFKKALGYPPLEILPKLIKLSPLTKYVITCHMRGQGTSKKDRVRYAKIPQIAKVLARLDSPRHKKFLLNLIRQLYA